MLPNKLDGHFAERLGRTVLLNCLSELTVPFALADEPRRARLLADSVLRIRSPRARCIIGFIEGRHAKAIFSNVVHACGDEIREGGCCTTDYSHVDLNNCPVHFLARQPDHIWICEVQLHSVVESHPRDYRDAVKNRFVSRGISKGRILGSTYNRPTTKTPVTAIFCDLRRLRFQMNGNGTAINNTSVIMFIVEFATKNWWTFTPQ